MQSKEEECRKPDRVLQRAESNWSEFLDTISLGHLSLDPFCYLLLFPDVCDGFYPQVRSSK